MQQQPLRSLAEVQRAHDIMHAVAAEEIDIGIPDSLRVKFHVAHDVLSWVLQGACNEMFACILAQVERDANALGYHLERLQ